MSRLKLPVRRLVQDSRSTEFTVTTILSNPPLLVTSARAATKTTNASNSDDVEDNVEIINCPSDTQHILECRRGIAAVGVEHVQHTLMVGYTEEVPLTYDLFLHTMRYSIYTALVEPNYYGDLKNGNRVVNPGEDDEDATTADDHAEKFVHTDYTTIAAAAPGGGNGGADTTVTCTAESSGESILGYSAGVRKNRCVGQCSQRNSHRHMHRGEKKHEHFSSDRYSSDHLELVREGMVADLSSFRFIRSCGRCPALTAAATPAAAAPGTADAVAESTSSCPINNLHHNPIPFDATSNADYVEENGSHHHHDDDDDNESDVNDKQGSDTPKSMVATPDTSDAPGRPLERAIGEIEESEETLGCEKIGTNPREIIREESDVCSIAGEFVLSSRCLSFHVELKAGQVLHVSYSARKRFRRRRDQPADASRGIDIPPVRVSAELLFPLSLPLPAAAAAARTAVAPLYSRQQEERHIPVEMYHSMSARAMFPWSCEQHHQNLASFPTADPPPCPPPFSSCHHPNKGNSSSSGGGDDTADAACIGDLQVVGFLCDTAHAHAHFSASLSSRNSKRSSRAESVGIHTNIFHADEPSTGMHAHIHEWMNAELGSASARAREWQGERLVTTIIPDLSMPFNVITLVNTVFAFLLGSLINVLAGRRRNQKKSANILKSQENEDRCSKKTNKKKNEMEHDINEEKDVTGLDLQQTTIGIKP